MIFKDYHFKKFINQTLDENNFYAPTPVQCHVIPKALKGDNVVVESATGSGKTLAFILPIMEKIDVANNTIQALIIAPTRELAEQLFTVANLFKKNLPEIDIKLVIGGQNRLQEMKYFETKQPHIVIGTLGRIKDLAIDMNILKIYTANFVVIDEADMVFDMKELVDVDKIIGLVQNKPKFMIFSATLPKALRHFLNKYLNGTLVIELREKNLTTSNIEHIMIPCKAKNKDEVLLSLFNCINPYLCLIFANKLDEVNRIAEFLAEKGIKVGKLHGDLDDRNRKQTIKRIRDLQYQYVVVSDIASRGIDITGASHIINYDLPNDIEFYIHRTGRTARYDQKGYAFSLYAYDDENYINLLKQKGLIPTFMKIVGTELKPTKLVVKKPSIIESKRKEISGKIPLAKKVKPGYKKKRKAEIDAELKKFKRERIEDIYRKRAKKHEDR